MPHRQGGVVNKTKMMMNFGLHKVGETMYVHVYTYSYLCHALCVYYKAYAFKLLTNQQGIFPVYVCHPLLPPQNICMDHWYTVVYVCTAAAPIHANVHRMTNTRSACSSL